MNAYGIVPTDLDLRISPQRRIDLTDSETAPTGSENTTVTQEVIDRAVTKFHAFAGRYYQLPITPRADADPEEIVLLPDLVKRTVVAIAAYDLMALKPEWLDRGEQQPYWAALNKETNAFLAGLSDRNRPVVLPAAEERLIPTETSGGALMTSDTSLFTRCTMRRF